jgi:hypothetical protein
MSKHLLLVRAQVKASGDQFWFGVYHQIQTLGQGERYRAAREATGEIESLVDDFDLPVFLTGDWNAKWTHRVMDPFRKHGWRSDVTMRPQLDTFEERDIDYFLWKNLSARGNTNDRSLQVTKKWTENIVGSDHDAKKIRVLLK